MSPGRPVPWYREVSPAQWRVLVAAQMGWMLDAMDVMLYAFALSKIQDEFHLSAAAAGALASATLVTSAAGGILAGWLADRFGRTRALIGSILAYSVFTALTATAGSLAELVLWRSLVGIGLGGEWAAGAVLVSESWPSAHRGKAIGLMQGGWAIGYILAALLAAAVLPVSGWRVLFALGVLPALFTIWIQRRVPESAVWRETHAQPAPPAGRGVGSIFRPPLRRVTILAVALTTSVLFAYWGLFTWIPSFLAKPAAEGGAGLGIIKSSAWIIPMQVGAFLGYTLFGFLADRFGRRPVFVAFLACAAVLAPVYGQLARHETLLLVLGPLIGFFGHGYFSVFGAMLAELFPTRIRGFAQGLTYNIGRAVSALAPWSIGALADRYGIGSALALTAAFFVAGAALMLRLPETRGHDLTSD